MTEHVPRAGRADDGQNVGADRRDGVSIQVIGPWRLVLPAHVDRDHPSAARGQLAEDREEVLFASGVAGYQPRHVPLAGPGHRNRLEGRERAAAGVDRGPLDSIGQVEAGRCAHSGEHYPAILNETSTEPAKADRETSPNGAGRNPLKIASGSRAGTRSDQEAFRLVASSRPASG